MKELSSLIITSLDWLKKDTFLEVQKPTMQEGTKSVHGIATSDAISPVQIDSHGKSVGNQIPTKYSTYSYCSTLTSSKSCSLQTND